MRRRSNCSWSPAIAISSSHRNSSLSPFAPRFRRVVAGDHLTMIKATDARAEGLNLLIAALSRRPEPPAASATLRASALEMTEPQVERTLAERKDQA